MSVVSVSATLARLVLPACCAPVGPRMCAVAGYGHRATSAADEPEDCQDCGHSGSHEGLPFASGSRVNHRSMFDLIEL